MMRGLNISIAIFHTLLQPIRYSDCNGESSIVAWVQETHVRLLYVCNSIIPAHFGPDFYTVANTSANAASIRETIFYTVVTFLVEFYILIKFIVLLV